ncbi:hypothetical protein CPA50_09185 [Marinobacter sp. ANT_B65]|nr:hypothetical protein CPA50_09185 [Marinobacter sp. ANT_B65]
MVSFIAAAFGIFFLYILWDSSGSISDKIFGGVLIIIISIFFIYIGIVGQGWNQYDIADDLSFYKKIKKKYNIRW